MSTSSPSVPTTTTSICESMSALSHSRRPAGVETKDPTDAQLMGLFAARCFRSRLKMRDGMETCAVRGRWATRKSSSGRVSMMSKLEDEDASAIVSSGPMTVLLWDGDGGADPLSDSQSIFSNGIGRSFRFFCMDWRSSSSSVLVVLHAVDAVSVHTYTHTQRGGDETTYHFQQTFPSTGPLHPRSTPSSSG